MMEDQCFICGGGGGSLTNNIYSGNLLIGSSPSVLKTGSCSLLSSNLDVIFILRNVLEVPSVHLENHLKECGTEPEDWIRLCDKCTQLTRNARQLDEEIRKLENQLRCVRNKVVDKMISSRYSQRDNDRVNVNQTAYHGNSSTFRENIRSFVKNHNYSGNLDGTSDNQAKFQEGDKLAKYLASQENSSGAKILLVEKCVEETVQVEASATPSSSSSPPPAPSCPLEDEGSSFEPSDDNDDDDNEEDHKDSCWKKNTKTSSYPHHVRNKHLKNVKNTCPICGRNFSYNRPLWRHMLTSHEDDPKTLKLKEENGIVLKVCSMVGCSTTLFTVEEQDKHMKKMHGGGDPKRGRGPWICEICGKEKSTFGYLNMHRKSVHKVDKDGNPLNLGKLLCNLCGREYSDRMSLAKHVRLNHNKRFSVSCHVCGVGLPCKRTLSLHLLRVHKEDPEARRLGEEEGLRLINCEVKGCTGVFLREEELGKHKEKMHGGGVDLEGRRFECKVCGKGFYLRSQLMYHGKGHERSMGKAWKCTSCEKGFGSKKTLRYHQRKVHNF